MTKITDLVKDSFLHRHLSIAKALVYDKCGFEFDNLILEDESMEYGACTFSLNNNVIRFRISKTTPHKLGQFVTIWKRGKEGITQPFDLTDEFDFLIVASHNNHEHGPFIFPKSVLLHQGIINGNLKEGKRGIRVYPPWAMATNKQAEKTQLWQLTYFLDIHERTNIDFAKQLLAAQHKED
jgi:hypothetical protein